MNIDKGLLWGPERKQEIGQSSANNKYICKVHGIVKHITLYINLK